MEKLKESIPSDEMRIYSLLNELDGEIKKKVKSKEEATKYLRMKKNIEDSLQKILLLKENKDVLEEWKSKFDNLPKKVDMLREFEIPSGHEEFRYEILENPEQIKKIFEWLFDAKQLLENVEVPKEEIVKEREKLQRLVETIKTPKTKPTGDDVIIFYSREENVAKISIPLDILIHKPEYVRIHSIPIVHAPREKIDTQKLNSIIEKFQQERKRLVEMEKNYEIAEKKLKGVREDLLPLLEEELKNVERKEEDLREKYKKITTGLFISYGNLCQMFGLELENIDTSTIQNFHSSMKILEVALSRANSFLYENLKEKLKWLNIPVPTEINENTLNILKVELKRKTEELRKRMELYEKVKEWITKYKDDIETLEGNLKALDFLNVIICISLAIVRVIYQKSNPVSFVEDRAEQIEKEVKNIYSGVFGDEDLRFEHVGRGRFKCSTVHQDNITHPAGADEPVVSMGIMLALAKTMGLPIIMDEAVNNFIYSKISRISRDSTNNISYSREDTFRGNLEKDGTIRFLQITSRL
jgi:DNA repair exonuclease SbcCD ATPase subunit